MIKGYNVDAVLKDMAYNQNLKNKLSHKKRRNNPKKASFIETMEKVQRGELVCK